MKSVAGASGVAGATFSTDATNGNGLERDGRDDATGAPRFDC